MKPVRAAAARMRVGVIRNRNLGFALHLGRWSSSVEGFGFKGSPFCDDVICVSKTVLRSCGNSKQGNGFCICAIAVGGKASRDSRIASLLESHAIVNCI